MYGEKARVRTCKKKKKKKNQLPRVHDDPGRHARGVAIVYARSGADASFGRRAVLGHLRRIFIDAGSPAPGIAGHARAYRPFLRRPAGGPDRDRSWIYPLPPPTSRSPWFIPQALGVVLAIAAVGLLLLTATSSEGEQRVFVAGTLLLLGGAAAQLPMSALFAGLIAAVFWKNAGGSARESVARDAAYLEHPLYGAAADLRGCAD